MFNLDDLIKLDNFELLNIENDESKLFQLLLQPDGKALFQRLLSNPVYFNDLVRHPLFIPAILHVVKNGPFKNTSVFFWLAGSDEGCKILLQLLDSVRFKEALFQNAHFTQTLLHIVESGPNKNTSALYWLALRENAHQILYKFTCHQKLRDTLFQNIDFIPALLKIVDHEPNKNTSPLFWLTISDNGLQTLDECLRIPRFNDSFLQSDCLVTAFLSIIDNGPNKDTTALFWLINSDRGRKILNQLLENKPFIESLITNANFIPAFLKRIADGPNNNGSMLFWLANTGHFILSHFLSVKRVREALLEHVDFIPTILTSIKHGFHSVFVSLASSNEGRLLLRELFERESCKKELLQHESFIPEFLKIIQRGIYANSFALFWLVRDENGCEVLRQLFDDATLKAQLLKNRQFIDMILQTIQWGKFEHTASYWLLWAQEGLQVLQKFLAKNKQFIARLVQDPDFIPEFSKNVAFILSTIAGHQLLQQLLNDSPFTDKLFQHACFIPALFKRIQTGPDKYTSAFHKMTTSTQDLLILKQMLKHVDFKKRLIQSDAFIEAMLFQNSDGSIVFLKLLDSSDGQSIIQTLMATPEFMEKFCLHFHLDVSGEQLSWIYQSNLGFPLLKRLLQEKHQALLEIPLRELLNHPQIQLYVQLGILDPSLFLLLSATEAGDTYAYYLQHPQCSPWVMSNKGSSLKDLIAPSALGDIEKKERIQALKSMIVIRQKQASMHNLVTAPAALDADIDAAVEPIAPALPPATTVSSKIDGVEDAVIQEFQQHMAWLYSQPRLTAYHDLSKALFNNSMIRNSHAFPVILGQFKKLCSWMNGYLQANIDISGPERYWEYDLAHLCEEGVQSTFKEIFATLSKASELILYLQHAESTASADYCRLLSIPENVEIHLPKAAIAAEIGFASGLPAHDIYLINLNKKQRHWIAQSTMDILIHQQALIDFLVDRLSLGVKEISYDELMKKYFYYKYSRLFSSEMTVMAFMSFVTGLSEDMLASKDYSDTLVLPIRSDLNDRLTEKAKAYVDHLPLYVVRSAFEKQTDLIWQFLTANPHQLNEDERSLVDDFLSQCEHASDGLALIKYCIESHRDSLDKINLNALFYKNAQGISLFSLIIANPLFTEWLFDYNLVKVQNRNNVLRIGFSEKNSPMHSLKSALLASQDTLTAIESAFTQPGTLYFWLFYFQQDGLRNELFLAILNFIIRSPKQWYAYDSLSALLYDMVRSKNLTEESRVLIQSFLDIRFREHVKLQDAHCWMIAALMINPEETILTTLRTNPWALRTLTEPAHMNTIRCLLNRNEAALLEIDDLLRQAQEALRKLTMFHSNTTGEANDHVIQNQPCSQT